MLLKIFADGFEYQEGAILGFGERKDADTGTVTKISTLSEEKMEILDNVQTHNLGQERNVGFVNYELGIRGKHNLEAASRKMVLNKSADLISHSGSQYKKFRKQAAEIKELKVSWNRKMKGLEEKRFSQKEIVNTNLERQKLDDLKFLQNKATIGPFTTSEEVTNYVENEPESKEKNLRMYIEVRFQRNTCRIYRKEAAVFRFKKRRKKFINN